MTDQAAIPLIFIPENGVETGPLDDGQRAWAQANGFAGQQGRLLAMPGPDGAIAAWLFGTGAAQGRPVFVAGLAAAGLLQGRGDLDALVVVLGREDDRLVAQYVADLLHRLGGGPGGEGAQQHQI